MSDYQLSLHNYTEKSVAVFGDTKPFSDRLKELGGRYNPNLTLNGEKTPGWIFSNKKKEELQQLINNINNGEIDVQNKSDTSSVLSELRKIRQSVDRCIRELENK
jgi:hypothetical protein